MNKEKITTIIVAVAISIILILCSSYLVRSCQQTIDEAGGLREIIIQEGKVAKSIYKDINDDNYTKPTNP